MKKLGIMDAHIMRLAIQDESVRSEEFRYDHQLHGILRVCSGYNCYQVADLPGHSRRDHCCARPTIRQQEESPKNRPTRQFHFGATSPLEVGELSTLHQGGTTVRPV